MTSKNKTYDDIKREQGFTLIEVLVTVVVVGILVAIAFPSVNGLVDKVK